MHQNFPLLDSIGLPSDLRKLPMASLPQLAVELRAYLLYTLNQCGGHLSANLGCVELTLALHYIFNTPQDSLIWDTGHQAYCHKILTGRKNTLHTIRQQDGLAPFPARAESIYDCFGVGHCGTSLSAATGIALANDLSGAQKQTLAIIGDGALTSGMAFEALNYLSVCKANVLIVLNDNQFSISPTVGGLAEYVHLFKKMGFKYFGPVDGHCLPTLIKKLRRIKKTAGPRIIHVITKKGKGYFPAEQDPIKYHAVKSGFQTLSNTVSKKTNHYGAILGAWLCNKAKEDPRLMVLTPGMAEGSGLKDFAKQYPQRFIDVGVAEQHCITLAAGLAVQGYKPVVAVYSTFLQRAYDQIIHDIALQKLPVLFAIDRAGIVGADGPTHGGFFDLSYLSCIPNLIIMAPADVMECKAMLTTGWMQSQPCAIRYPRDPQLQSDADTAAESIQIGKATILKKGEKIALLAFGSMVSPAIEVAEYLNATVINMRFIKPLDKKMIQWMAKEHDLLVTLEENVIRGGAGSAVNEYVMENNIRTSVLNLGLPDHFIEHGVTSTLLSKYGLNVEGIISAINKRVALDLNTVPLTIMEK